MDAGPPADRRSRSISRVGSSSAANNSAAPARLFSVLRFDILLNPDEHFGPSLAVVLEDFGAASERDFVEAGFGHRQPRPAAGRLEREGDRRPGLARIIDGRIYRSGMPLPGEPAWRRHLRHLD